MRVSGLGWDELVLVGIGTGNPDHLTLEGVRAIRSADLVIIPRKGEDKADLAGLRRHICASVIEGDSPEIVEFDLPVRDASGDYLAGVSDWHDAIARSWAAAVSGHLKKGGRVALLIWGDPSLYDSSLRIAERLDPRPKITVIPGITALQALTAAHAIPLNDVGAPVLITTGRQLRDKGWPGGVDTLAVMLDGNCAFTGLVGQGVDIWWGAYLGMENQIIFSGPVDEVADTIVDAREKARKDHGWIMDIYLLRRR